MNEEIKNPERAVEYTTLKQWKRIMALVKRNTANKSSSVRRTKKID